MEEEQPGGGAPPQITRGQLLADTIVFQIKLAIDGLRDLVLIPVSLIAALVSFLRAGRGVGREFYDVVAFGRDTERQINLFGAADRMYPEDDSKAASELDELLGRVEGAVRNGYEGERFSKVRARLEAALDKFEERDRNRTGDEQDGDAA
jgi:hypothetical protein